MGKIDKNFHFYAARKNGTFDYRHPKKPITGKMAKDDVLIMRDNEEKYFRQSMRMGKRWPGASDIGQGLKTVKKKGILQSMRESAMKAILPKKMEVHNVHRNKHSTSEIPQTYGHR